MKIGRRNLGVAALLGALTLAGPAAHAGTHVDVIIGVPSAPVYTPPPVYVVPVPPPIVVYPAPPPVVYAPSPPVYVAPPQEPVYLVESQVTWGAPVMVMPGQVCRQYSRWLAVNGAWQPKYGVACQERDGRWRHHHDWR